MRHWLFGLLLVGSIQTELSQAQFADLFRPSPVSANAGTHYMVPMRDGVRLSTQVYLPEGEGPFPTILIRTVYGKANANRGPTAIDFPSHGFALVIQDSRGRFDSEGGFGTFEFEPQDGHDTVEWIAKQPWSNGRVGMFGASAMGIAANFAATTAPPHLVANFVCVAHGCDYRFGRYPGGLFLKNLNENWYKGLGTPLDPCIGPRCELYDERAAHLDVRQHYGKIRVPTIHVGGWYDIFSEATVENFEGFDRFGDEPARGKQHLVMGAFAHLPMNGKLRYPEEAARPDTQLAIDWFNFWLKGEGEDPQGREIPKARYFVMGDPFDPQAPGNRWKTSMEWPPVCERKAFYLEASGTLTEAGPGTDDARSYRYDPRTPVPTVGGNNLFLPRGPMDQSPVADRPDVLRFLSEPLPAAVEIAGRVEARLFVSTDGPDTDFLVKLIDIYPDGYQALVLDHGMRLRFREGLDKQLPATPGEVYELSINLGTTALVFNRGHRIAVHVTSSNSPRFEPHPNTWEVVTDPAQARVAQNTLHLGPSHPSRLILPVCEILLDGVAETR